MKEYPSIKDFDNKKHDPLIPVVLTEKYDGSNIRISWNYKTGFSTLMGTRYEYITSRENPFYVVYDLFKELKDEIEKILIDNYKKEEVTLFFELHGPSSEFGKHDFNEKLKLSLFDIFVRAKGFVKPLVLYEQFHHLGMPRIIHIGPLTSDIIEGVENNMYDLKEGVVIKDMEYSKKGFYNLNYRKLKTRNWYERLRLHEIS